MSSIAAVTHWIWDIIGWMRKFPARPKEAAVVVLNLAARTQMRLLGGIECGPFTELQHVGAQQYRLLCLLAYISTYLI